MATAREAFIGTQLRGRRERLETAIAEFGATAQLIHLLQDVDAALERMNNGTYGLCDACHLPIEEERLMADPLIRLCIEHLTSDQQRALEQDLALAARIQNTLLPKRDVTFGDWEIHYRYEPAGPVSGDYCDLLNVGSDRGDLYFLLGDVAGKGVAASMLMAHLHAIFRSLVGVGLPTHQLAERANRVFSESTMATHYATLICGRAGRGGEVEICNAGHCLPLWVGKDQVRSIESTGLPLGMFSTTEYTAEKMQLTKGESLFLFTDGLIEARDASNVEYGGNRLASTVGKHHALPAQGLADACLQDLSAFLAGAPKTDDLTIMVIRRLV
jgi:sigma-B regulation protein RsbU (phosphoserine phosphatase)